MSSESSSLESSKPKTTSTNTTTNNADDIFPLKYVFVSILFVLGFLAIVFFAINSDA